MNRAIGVPLTAASLLLVACAKLAGLSNLELVDCAGSSCGPLGSGGSGGGIKGAAGGNGSAGRSGAPGACVPSTCAVQGKNCGAVDDGCGHKLECGAGPCGTNLACNAMNVAVPNVCGCSPGTFVCTGDGNKTLEQCIANGSGYRLVAVCAADNACNPDPKSPGCTTCTDATQQQCSGNAVFRCDPTIDPMKPPGFVPLKSCDAPSVCTATSPTQAACTKCTPGETYCEVATLKRCKPDGSDADTIATCGSAALCAESVYTGACVKLACEPNERRCKGGSIQVCNATRTGFDDVTTCSAPTPACDDVTQSCVARGPALVRVGSSFYIESTEVTREQYNAFLSALTAGAPAPVPPPGCTTTLSPAFTDELSLPATNVSWCDAFAYCDWAKERLCGKIGGGPSSPMSSMASDASQWFRACGGDAGLAYPYGSTYEATRCAGADAAPAGAAGAPAVGPVKPGSFAMCQGAVTGVFDLSGNVAEWEDACSASSAPDDMCSVRGGSYLSHAEALRCSSVATRSRATRAPDVGFRCCAD